MATISDVVANLGRLSKICQRPIDDPEVLVFIADAVCSKLSPDQALIAIREWSVTKSKFPTPAELVAIMIPPTTDRDVANELAARMLGAISRRGYRWGGLFQYDGHATFQQAMLAEFGDERGADIVDRAGGWPEFCRQYDPVQNTNARPQLRELAEAMGRREGNVARAFLEAPRDETKLLGMGPIRDTVGDYLESLKSKVTKEPENMRETDANAEPRL